MPAHLGQRAPDIALPVRPEVKRKQAGAVHDQRHDARKDENGNEDRGDRVEPSPAVPVDQQGRDDDADGTERVRHDVLCGAEH